MIRRHGQVIILELSTSALWIHTIHNSSWLLSFSFSTLLSSRALLWEQQFSCDKMPKKFNTSAKCQAWVAGMVAHYSLLKSSTHSPMTETKKGSKWLHSSVEKWPREEEVQSRKLQLRRQWETWYKLNSSAGKGTHQHLIGCSPQSSVTREALWKLKGKWNCQIIWHKIRVDAKYFIVKRIQINL